jgi:1-aminocyclopropane-1-carboxylate deaminase/D-cysteine desulfhydrase-like pyridoxal-dependent ACC family enzyme
VDRRVTEVIRLLFQTEGVVLDPVYTGKAMAGFIDLIRRGSFHKTDRVVFFHTGGTPALFPHRGAILEFLRRPA